MEDEKITDTGLGATACASESQKWNGTTADLMSSAVATRQKPPTMTGSCPALAIIEPMLAKSSVPDRA